MKRRNQHFRLVNRRKPSKVKVNWILLGPAAMTPPLADFLPMPVLPRWLDSQPAVLRGGIDRET